MANILIGIGIISVVVSLGLMSVVMPLTIKFKIYLHL
jgi:amino acid permease